MTYSPSRLFLFWNRCVYDKIQYLFDRIKQNKTEKIREDYKE